MLGYIGTFRKGVNISMLFPSGLTIDYQKKKVISIVVHTDQIKIVF